MAKKKSKKYAPQRKFDGKNFSFRNSFSSKIAAQKYAQMERDDRGYNDRVVKVSGDYLVYGRKKR